MAAEKGAAVDDKGLLQDAETIDEDGTTYIVIKEEYRQHVFGRSGVTMLPRLGPAELYEVVGFQVNKLKEAADLCTSCTFCHLCTWRQLGALGALDALYALDALDALEARLAKIPESPEIYKTSTKSYL